MLILIFSFFLGFGKFDPFNTGGIYFDIITILMIINIAVFSTVVKHIKYYKSILIYLFLIGFAMFYFGLFYESTHFGTYIFNLKYFAAIIIFWFLSYSFNKNPKLCIISIILFAISCSLIAVLYHFDYLESISEIRKGRLWIFEENPNSISVRMVIAFIIITYVLIENPIKSKTISFFLSLSLPSIFIFVVATNSRGSFIALMVGITIIIYFSNINKYLKYFMSLIGTVLLYWVWGYFKTSSIFNRLIDDNLLGGRGKIWLNSIKIFYDYPFGIGEGGYINEMTTRYSSTADTHNIFLYISICGGFISLILFILFLRIISINAFKNFKTGDPFSLTLLLIILILVSKTGGVLTYLVMWYIFAVINSYDFKKLRNTWHIL